MQRIVSKTLRKARDERYQAVPDLSFDLKNLQRQLEADARQPRLPCPSCGHENPVGGAFCGKCGHALSEPQSLPETLALPVPAPQPVSAQPGSDSRTRPAGGHPCG